jgi:hypothetical protein
LQSEIATDFMMFPSAHSKVPAAHLRVSSSLSMNARNATTTTTATTATTATTTTTTTTTTTMVII